MKTLKEFVNESVFDTDVYEETKSDQNIFGREHVIINVKNKTATLENPEKDWQNKFDIYNQKALDDFLNTYGVNHLVFNCTKKGDWRIENILYTRFDNKSFDFHGITIDFLDCGLTEIAGDTISNLNIDTNGWRLYFRPSDYNKKTLTLKKVNAKCGRLLLEAADFNLVNTNIDCEKCTVKTNKENQTFIEIANEIFNGDTVKNPIERLGLKGINTEVIEVGVNKFKIDNLPKSANSIYISNKRSYKPFDGLGKIVGGPATSADGKYILELVRNNALN